MNESDAWKIEFVINVWVAGKIKGETYKTDFQYHVCCLKIRFKSQRLLNQVTEGSGCGPQAPMDGLKTAGM